MCKTNGCAQIHVIYLGACLVNGGLYTVTNMADEYRFDRMAADCSTMNCPDADDVFEQAWNEFQNQFDYDTVQTFTGSVKAQNTPHVERNQIWEFRRVPKLHGHGFTDNQWYIQTMIEQGENQNWRLAKEMNNDRICYVAKPLDLHSLDAANPSGSLMSAYQQWELLPLNTTEVRKDRPCQDLDCAFVIKNAANQQFLQKFNDNIDIFNWIGHVNFGTGPVSDGSAAVWKITSVFKDPAFYWEHFFKYENKADVTVSVTVEVVYGVTQTGEIEMTSNEQPSIEAGLRSSPDLRDDEVLLNNFKQTTKLSWQNSEYMMQKATFEISAEPGQIVTLMQPVMTMEHYDDEGQIVIRSMAFKRVNEPLPLDQCSYEEAAAEATEETVLETAAEDECASDPLLVDGALYTIRNAKYQTRKLAMWGGGWAWDFGTFESKHLNEDQIWKLRKDSKTGAWFLFNKYYRDNRLAQWGADVQTWGWDITKETGSDDGALREEHLWYLIRTEDGYFEIKNYHYQDYYLMTWNDEDKTTGSGGFSYCCWFVH